MTKTIRIYDNKFHKHLCSIKLKHGFSSIEAMLKGMEKVYRLHLRELQCHKRK